MKNLRNSANKSGKHPYWCLYIVVYYLWREIGSIQELFHLIIQLSSSLLNQNSGSSSIYSLSTFIKFASISVLLPFSLLIFVKEEAFEDALQWYTFSLDCFTKNPQDNKDIAKLQVFHSFDLPNMARLLT